MRGLRKCHQRVRLRVEDVKLRDRNALWVENVYFRWFLHVQIYDGFSAVAFHLHVVDVVGAVTKFLRIAFYRKIFEVLPQMMRNDVEVVVQCRQYESPISS